MDSPQERLKALLFHIDLGACMGALQCPTGVFHIGVLMKQEDRTGRVIQTFQGAPFLEDLAVVLGYESLAALLAEDEEKPAP